MTFYRTYLVTIVGMSVVIAVLTSYSDVGVPDEIAAVTGPIIMSCVALMTLSKGGRAWNYVIVASSVAGGWMWLTDVLDTRPFSFELLVVVVPIAAMSLLYTAVFLVHRLSKSRTTED